MYATGNNIGERTYDYRKIAKEGYQEKVNIVFRCVDKRAHGASTMDFVFAK